jgi:hypothetical protein
MAIVTPGTTAPVESVTEPVTSAEFVAWPKATPLQSAKSATGMLIRMSIFASKSIY